MGLESGGGAPGSQEEAGSWCKPGLIMARSVQANLLMAFGRSIGRSEAEALSDAVSLRTRFGNPYCGPGNAVYSFGPGFQASGHAATDFRIFQ
jgi:hypothetical protein